MDVDLRQLLSVIRRRLWIILLLPLIAAVFAYWVSSREAPKYAATTVIRVYPASTTGVADYDAILSSQSLIETYRQLIVSRPVLESVIAELSLDATADSLRGRVSATSVENTQLIQISVSDTDPELAADVANAISRSFQTYVAQQVAEAGATMRSALDAEIDAAEQRLDETVQQIQAIEAQDAITAEDEARLSMLRTQLDQLQEAYSQLLGLSQSLVLNMTAGEAQVAVSELATAPTAPFAPRVAFRTVLGLIAGLIVAGATVFAVEYLDDTITANAALNALVGAPLLATIDRMPKVRKGRRALVALEHPRSGGIESIRFLRTNLEYIARAGGMRSFAFASPMTGEGKSTVVANLAAVMAQVGIPVVVIDADMWHSSQHELFKTRNDVGLSTLLSRNERNWTSVAAPSGIPNLRLITSGPLPPDPADLLGRNLKMIVDEVVAAGHVVLIDTPPILVGADTLIVSGCVDGIVMICRDRQTRRYALSRAISVLKPTGAKIIGTVVNMQPSGRTVRRADESSRSRRVGLPTVPAQTVSASYTQSPFAAGDNTTP